MKVNVSVCLCQPGVGLFSFGSWVLPARPGLRGPALRGLVLHLTADH